MTTLRPASPQTGNDAGRFSHRPHTSPASHEMRQNTAPHRRKGAMPTTPTPYADGIGTGRKQSNRKPHDGSRPSVTRSAPVTADRRPPTDGAPIYSGRRAIDMRPAATMTDKKNPATETVTGFFALALSDISVSALCRSLSFPRNGVFHRFLHSWALGP